MTVLPILLLGDPRLRQKAESVGKLDKKIQKLAQDLLETMVANDCVGLSAPQVGALKRLFVLHGAYLEPQPGPHVVVINPVLLEKSGGCASTEGSPCVHLLEGTITRFSKVVLAYTDLQGRKRTLAPPEGSLTAIAIQHEMDHHNGLLFFDHLPEASRPAFNQQLLAKGLPTIETSTAPN